jgi:hypothetical protein
MVFLAVRRTLFALALSSLASLAATQLLASQDTSRVVISGTVVDPLGTPIEGAEVLVSGMAKSAFSTSEGRFRLEIPKTPVILVQIRRPGYSAQLIKLAGSWNGTVLLQPGTFRLPDVQVTARYAKPAEYAATSKYDDFFRRRRLGLGDFLDHDEIERRSPSSTAQILEARPGIKVSIHPAGVPQGTVISFSRCNEYPPRINVYVDGRKLIPEAGTQLVANEAASSFNDSRERQAENEQTIDKRYRLRSMVGELLGRINPRDIEMMEIFRGPGELPAEFNDGNCGAIAIWTRYNH